MTQENVQKEQRSAMRTGGIALIVLGALVAAVVVTANTQEYRKHRELRARASSEMSYDQLGIDNSMPGEAVLAFANEQLLAATPDEQHAHDRRMLTGSGSGSGSGTTAAPTSSPTPSPTTASPTTAAPTTGAPTTGAPTTGAPTTGSPTPAATPAAQTFDKTTAGKHVTTFTSDQDYSNVGSTETNALRDAVALRAGAPADYVEVTAAAGSTIFTITVYAGPGMVLADIQTAMTFTGGVTGFTTFLNAISGFSGVGVTGYSVTVTQATSSGSSGLSTGALVGIIVGSVVGVALIAGIIFLVMKKAGSPKGATAPEY